MAKLEHDSSEEKGYRFELLVKYVLHALPPEEIEAIDTHLQTHEIDRDTVAGLVAYVKANPHKSVQDILNDSYSMMQQSLDPLTKRKTHYLVKWGVGVGIAVSLSVICWWIYSKKSIGHRSEFIASHLNEAYQSPIVRSSDTPIWVFQYDRKMYASAYQELATIIEQDTTNPQAVFYAAMSLTQLFGSSDSLAIALLSKPILANSLYHEQAQWYKALLHIRLGNEQEAEKLLKAIREEQDHYRREYAQKLLEMK